VNADHKKTRRQTLKEEFTNLPNLLTLARIAVIPLVLALVDDIDPLRSLWACLLFLAASLTDAVDGYLARRSHLVSVLGKFLDPLADKLLVMAVLVYLVRIGRVPDWVAVVLIGRDIAITGLREIAMSENLVIAASPWGKNKTAFQLIGIAFLILHFPYPLLLTDWIIDFHVVGIWVIYISLFFSIFSAIQYFKFFWNAAEAKARRAIEREEAAAAEGRPGETDSPVDRAPDAGRSS
jgi:CDP-diacylglycerol---glycerol-3-phosphate 3-phosphatidyltransferase